MNKVLILIQLPLPHKSYGSMNKQSASHRWIFRAWTAALLGGNVALLSLAANAQPDEAAAPAVAGWNDNYAYDLPESLVAEGRRHMAQHAYSEAQAAYSRAWQVTRINHGLESGEQIRPIEHLLDALLAQNKWEEFDQQINYLSWLNESAHRDDPEQRVEGLITISNWYRAAAATLDDSRSNWYLIRAKHLNWQAISVLERSFGPYDLRLAPLLYRVAMDHYYQAISTQRRGMTSYEYKTDDKVLVNGWALNKNETVGRSYRIGRENLLRIRALYAHHGQSSPLTDALLLVHLADWELVFENGDRAAALYQTAYDHLLSAGIPNHDVERFFDRPVVLPSTHLSLQWPLWESPWEEKPLEYVAWSPAYPGAQKPDDPLDTYRNRLESLMSQRAVVRLNPDSAFATGFESESDPHRFNYVVSDLDLSENPEVNDSLLDWVYAELPMLKLRPRILDGKLTVHEAVTLDYVFSPRR
ncbi:MAG: hypothetical protein RLZZ385_2125 [Pseudomonadota bacterium]